MSVMEQVTQLMDEVQVKHAHVIAAAGAIAAREEELRTAEKQLFVERSRARIGGFLAAANVNSNGQLGSGVSILPSPAMHPQVHLTYYKITFFVLPSMDGCRWVNWFVIVVTHMVYVN
jgi:hypothetical protein